MFIMLPKLVIFSLTLFCVVSGSVSSDYKCQHGLYPPNVAEHSVPKYVINLDLPPEERWTHLASDMTSNVKNLLDVLKNTIKSIVGSRIEADVFQFIDYAMGKMLKTLPEPYASEMASIANVTGIPVGEMVLYNVFYELTSLCTSIVAQNDHGHLIHGRNLDFGLLLGWDLKNHTWAITEALRPTVVDLDFVKDNQTVFRSASFAGYVGVLTSMKPGRFTLTTDRRFSLDGGILGIIQWVLGDHTSSWLGFQLRDVTMEATDYQDALDRLAKSQMLGPAYFILGGNSSGQGAIITKDRQVLTADVWTMAQSGYEWFLVETNYDHWKKPPFFDDRRTTAINCLKNLTSANLDFAGLYDVLSSQPNLNKLTTYTALMDSSKNQLEIYLQYCPDPCVPF